MDLGSFGDVSPGGEPLPWPAADGWLDRVAASPLAKHSVVRADLGLLHLDRYWREERQVHDDLVARLTRPVPAVDELLLEASAARLFPGDTYAEQHSAALRIAHRSITVLTGGPGRGKTTTVAGLLALLAEQAEHTGGRQLRIALAAPTGKAAARLQQAVAEALNDPPQSGKPEFTTEDRCRACKPAPCTDCSAGNSDPVLASGTIAPTAYHTTSS